ncbi:MAG: hypothetical protein COU71_02330 [Parcubacteria group bacterium CG10_big_fil_rev_8_21_14_0_10_38_31]|nr:MAG: hypothetical protein COU71_02330 [Parcubacteria group bacterium CG10_big_fil_rev_8_21_14_0_10_38_31]
MTNKKEGLLSEERFKGPIWNILGLAFLAFIIVSQVNSAGRGKEDQSSAIDAESAVVAMEEVLPKDGVILPVVWGSIGKEMVEKGVIDAEKFESIYAGRGGLSEEEKALLYGEANGNIKITPENAGVILNLTWAFGLSNKNPVLEGGPMMDPRYGGAGEFASTGGWSISRGDAMEHYSKYQFVVLTKEEQELVERVSKNIYRPCCGNSTYFPDCNHGMAMLGLLELLASNGATEEEMYQIALAVNSYWFPETYLTIEKYFQKRGVTWSQVDAKEVLGELYSSGAGYQQVLSDVEPVKIQGGGSCGV